MLGTHHTAARQVGQRTPDRQPVDPVALRETGLGRQLGTGRELTGYETSRQIGLDLLIERDPGTPGQRGAGSGAGLAATEADVTTFSVNGLFTTSGYVDV